MSMDELSATSIKPNAFLMETITITERLIRATTLDQLRNADGKARMNMPYWIELPGDKGTSETLAPALIFQFVGKHTDPEALQLQINHGYVWIQEKYG
jgi:hypothetical protein